MALTFAWLGGFCTPWRFAFIRLNSDSICFGSSPAFRSSALCRIRMRRLVHAAAPSPARTMRKKICVAPKLMLRDMESLSWHVMTYDVMITMYDTMRTRPFEGVSVALGSIGFEYSSGVTTSPSVMNVKIEMPTTWNQTSVCTSA